VNDYFCDIVESYTVTYSVTPTDGITQELLDKLNIPLEGQNDLELPKNSLLADYVYVFTATVN